MRCKLRAEIDLAAIPRINGMASWHHGHNSSWRPCCFAAYFAAEANSSGKHILYKKTQTQGESTNTTFTRQRNSKEESLRITKKRGKILYDPIFSTTVTRNVNTLTFQHLHPSTPLLTFLERSVLQDRPKELEQPVYPPNTTG